MSDSVPNPTDLRKQHIAHEASVCGIARLYYASSVLCGLAGILFLWLGIAWGSAAEMVIILFFGAIGALAIGVLFWMVARGIRRLRQWARTAATVFAAIGCLGSLRAVSDGLPGLPATALDYINLLRFPLSVAINGYILFLLQSKKGKIVFGPEYAAVMSLTPDIRYKTPPVLWVLLCIVILVFVAGIMIAASRIDWSTPLM